MVAAIVAGDPDGLTEMYDRYAAPLYAYCSSALPGPDAADVVRDTFLIATSRLEGLRDAGKLSSWLHAVARSECLRRRSAAGVTSPPPKMPRWDSADDAWAAVELPAELREQVLKACTDSTPTGRADRVSTAHRAGAFGRTGFPKPPGSPGPPSRRHSRAAAAVAMVAAVGATAGIIVVLAGGGSHRAQASTLANSGRLAGGSAGAAGRASASPSPGHQASPATGHPTPAKTALEGVISPGSSTGHGTPQASAPASGTSSSPASASSTASPSPSASRSPTASPSRSASPSASPKSTPGVLKVAPDTLALTSTGGEAASGKFVLSAVGGPVSDYVIKIPAGLSGKLTVTPATGSLADGGSVTVTVTVTSKIALNTYVTVDPGGITVTVLLSIKA